MTLVFVGARGAGPERCGRRARHRTCGRGDHLGCKRAADAKSRRKKGSGGEARAGRTTQRERVTRQKGRKSAEVNGGREQKARGKDAADAEVGRSACRGGPVSPRRKRAQRLAGAARECEPAKRRRRLQKATAGAKGGGTGEKARQSVFLPGPRRSACMRGRSLSGMRGSGRLRAAKEGAPRQKEAKKADAGFRSNPGRSAAEAPAESGGRKRAPRSLPCHALFPGHGENAVEDGPGIGRAARHIDVHRALGQHGIHASAPFAALAEHAAGNGAHAHGNRRFSVRARLPRCRAGPDACFPSPGR